MGSGLTMGGRTEVLLPGLLALFLSALAGTVCAEPSFPPTNTAATSDPFPDVPGLQPQVEFWVEVFTKLRQNEVLLHDTQYPRLRYEVFALPGMVDAGLNRDQADYLNARKERLAARLETLERKLARGDSLNLSEQQLRQQLDDAGGAEAVHDAAQRLRAQRGLRERFLDGVRRSGRYLAQMRRIFAEEHVPPDLALLPHVESSFNIEARSTAGAAGIWQFTRPTGRRYLHVSNALDERLDPIAATRAAAAYLRSAHELLGDWALAVTSYNHGTTGMLRAMNQYGVDFERIVREYDSDTFGFASRNFYTEFLAVREILNHPEKYFDESLQLDAPMQLDSLVLPRPISAPRLAHIVGADLETLAEVNPAWLNRAVQGKVALPANTVVWLPRGTHYAGNEVNARLRVAERNIPPLPVLDGQARKGLYKVRAGDTLGSIAYRQGVSLAALRSLNGIKADSHHIRAGQRLKLPSATAETRRAADTSKAKPGLHLVRNGENPFIIARRYKISLSSLLAENGLIQDAIIHPGQRLRIPAEAKP
jgi:membrane-bound lytic murein transglycosylase D